MPPSSRPFTAGAWSSLPTARSIHQPVLVANGESDKMVPTKKRSSHSARRLPDSELVTYPDAGHGGIFQFHAQFVQKVRIPRTVEPAPGGPQAQSAQTSGGGTGSCTSRFGA